MYTRPLGFNMAKLYWRIKRNGKWTWTPATIGGWTESSITLWKESQTDFNGEQIFSEEE